MIEQNGDGLRVTGPMLIANASALLRAGRGFLRSRATAGELVFDLSSVEETDSSALSVIFGLLRTARDCGVTMRIAHPPASMISQAALYGVSDSLPLA
ncbi:MAG: STAS domain-containing protein [Propionivibrio sp.]|uniref:STAS domain-containing protein n=1 Tax=Propionivibrio sp. TaxID=2212460 RepID=UPI001A6029A5|nr:STAS domain-containing protein [Propionivibrio sp.]MBL8416366.1 STAS domain-containing protein [Propionivibrio sp.]